MGISGLLPFLKNASRPANIRDFKGCTVAIDVYCWLHKGAFGCAEQLVRGEQTDGYIRYVMKYVNLLLHYGVKPILVFDGRNLPSKKEVELERRKRRRENKEKAAQFLREGRNKEARECMQRCVDITPEMARSCIVACRERNIDCIVAPYEADAQLAFLNTSGIAQIVITEDSDLTSFGCDRIMFKLNDSGDCVLYEKSALPSVFGLTADCFTFDKFRYMCIMSGCDYLASLHGIGLAKAKTFWAKVSNPDIRAVLPKIPCYLKKPGLIVNQAYIDGFVQANYTFLHQLVFDPITRTLRPLTDYPSWKQASDFPYCGEILDDETSLQMALGNLDLHSLRKVDHFNPDVQQPFVKSKYGARATHASMWSKSYKPGNSFQNVTSNLEAPSTKGKEMVVSTAFGNFQKKSTESKSNNQTAAKRKFLESSTYKAAAKKRVPTYDEETIEAQLMEDEDEEESVEEPVRKKMRIDDNASKKVVDNKNVKTVSKYFAFNKTDNDTPNDGKNEDSDEERIKNCEDSDEEKEDIGKVEARNRRTTTEDCGNWFEDIEVGASHEGKFIYRTDLEKSEEKENHGKIKKESILNKFKAVPKTADLKQNPKSVLSELSSSGSENGSAAVEEEEKIRKRNPFAKKLQKCSPSKKLSLSPKKQESPNENSATPDGDQQSVKYESFSQISVNSESLSQKSVIYESFSQTSVEIPASQLSMYSMDSESITFTPSSSQITENDEAEYSTDKKSPNSSNVKKVSPVLRIGLSRNFTPRTSLEGLSEKSSTSGPSRNFTPRTSLDGLSEKSKSLLNGTSPVSSPSITPGFFFTNTQKVSPGTPKPPTISQNNQDIGLSSKTISPVTSKPQNSGLISSKGPTPLTSKLGPARVSGLSKKQKPGGLGGLGGLKQPSVLAMFTRQPKKADL